MNKPNKLCTTFLAKNISLPKFERIHFTIHFLSPQKIDSYLNDPRADFGAPFGGDTSLFRKSQVMNKKVGIREAFHFEDEKNK